jgi:hypothetical protein
MLTEVMRHYRLVRPPVDVGFFETEHHAQVARDLWLPRPKTLYPWPSERFAVNHPRWEPYAGVPHVRICAGGAQ